MISRRLAGSSPVEDLRREVLRALQRGEVPGTVDRVQTALGGLILAAIGGAVMSALSGGLNSASTVFTLDLYKRWRPG